MKQCNSKALNSSDFLPQKLEGTGTPHIAMPSARQSFPGFCLAALQTMETETNINSTRIDHERLYSMQRPYVGQRRAVPFMSHQRPQEILAKSSGQLQESIEKETDGTPLIPYLRYLSFLHSATTCLSSRAHNLISSWNQGHV